MSYTKTTRFRVLRAVTYPDSRGKLQHAKEGDIVTDYPLSSANHDVRDGVLEVVNSTHEKGKEVDE